MPEWYSPTDQPPPFGVIVWALYGGDQFKAVRILRKKKRQPVWGRMRKRGVEFLRELPDCWRPLNAATWRMPLPDPVPPAFAEFEKPREMAIDTPREVRAWWRDPAAMTYSPAGAITPRECEGRIMRALLTEMSIRMESPRGGGSNSDWIARMIDKVERDNGKRETYWHSRFQPTSRDVSDYQRIMVDEKWLALLIKVERTVLVMRAVDPPYSWRQIGEDKEVYCSLEIVRRIYADAIGYVTKNANAAARTYAAAS